MIIVSLIYATTKPCLMEASEHHVAAIHRLTHLVNIQRRSLLVEGEKQLSSFQYSSLYLQLEVFSADIDRNIV